jgi:hypothetical protein
MVPDPQILEVVNLTDDPQEACELLIAEANDAGGTDNISALIIRIVEDTPPLDDHLPEVEAHEDDAPEIASDGHPEVETSEAVVEEGLEELMTAEEAAALEADGEPSFDLRGPWEGKRVAPKRCASCSAELLAGNLFCVECGTRIPDADTPEA